MAKVKKNFIAKPWINAVRDILASAKIKQTAVAAEIGVAQSVVARVLPDTPRRASARRPSAKSVLRIDRAVARLAGHPGVEDYLNFEAAMCGLLHDERFGNEALAKGVARCFSWYSNFFKPDAAERIPEIISALGESQAQKLSSGLNRALRRVIVSELLPSSTHGFQAVIDTLDANGIDRKEVLSDQCTAQLAYERFVQTVQHELHVQSPHTPARERRAATQRILDALANPDVLSAFRVSRDSTARDLREVTTIEDGGRTCRFDGDPSAWMEPFMAPSLKIKINHAPSVRQKGDHS